MCTTDDTLEKSLESSQHFVEVARGKDVEVGGSGGCGGSVWLWWFFVAVVVFCGCSVYSEINLNTILSELFLFQI